MRIYYKTSGQNNIYKTSGQNNIGLGNKAGYYLTTGSNNIEIGNFGAAADSKTIRIGTQGTQTAAYLAGISGSAVMGPSVVVSSTGRLGIVMSSARFKRDIRDMGGASSGLMKLRPVTFRYKNDPAGTLQYGLVAEEVERIYPNLVSYGTDGKIETVQYLTLGAMLLNELQKQVRENQLQAARIAKLSARVASSERKVDEVQAATAAKLRAMQASFEQGISALKQAGGTAAPVKF